MFKLAVSPSYFAPVTVALPGAKAKQVFDAEFKRLDATELKDLAARTAAGELDDAGYAREIVIGWKGVADENGELEFSDSNLDRLLDIYPVASSIVQGFFASLEGARAKN